MDFVELNKIVKNVKNLISLIPEKEIADNYFMIEKIFNTIDSINVEIMKIKEEPKGPETAKNISNVMSHIQTLKSNYNELVEKLNN